MGGADVVGVRLSPLGLPGEQLCAELCGVDVGEPVLGDPVARLGVPHPEDIPG